MLNTIRLIKKAFKEDRLEELSPGLQLLAILGCSLVGMAYLYLFFVFLVLVEEFAR